MHHLASKRLLSVTLLAALAGCSGSEDPVDLGHDVTGSALSDYEGSWDGYAEAYEFDDGSDRVRLALGPDGVGELTLGDAAEPPPPDPDLGYPPGDSEPKIGGDDNRVFAGFAYPVRDGSVADSRIRMHSASGEIYREWCDLQTPNYVTNSTPGFYACLPNAGFATTEDGCTLGDSGEVIDCGLISCLARCSCSEEDCGLGPHMEIEDIRIDATLESGGDKFVGTMVIGEERITVRLTRQ